MFLLLLTSISRQLAVAPWWADAYHDLAVILETGQRWHDAKQNLHFYLLTDPGEKEARAAQDEIYKIEAKEQEKTRRIAEQAAKAQEAAKQQAEEDTAKRRQFVESLSGNWKAARPGRRYDTWSLTSDFPNVEIQWTGYHASDGSFSPDQSHKLVGTMSGQNIYGSWDYSFELPRGLPCAGRPYKTKGIFTGTVSPDGQRISITESGYQLFISGCQWKQSDTQLVLERQ